VYVDDEFPGTPAEAEVVTGETSDVLVELRP
jgi:hypothetical protein